MAKSKGFTPEQKLEMRRSYEDGERLTPLSKRWGVSAPTMADYVRHAGGTLRNRGTPKNPATRKIVDMTPDPECGAGFPVEALALRGSEPSAVTYTDRLNRYALDGIKKDQEEKAEIKTPQAPVSRRIMPIE